MQGSNKSSRGEFSPLATQLQQAWLQSQIPKVQKRRLSSIPATAATAAHQRRAAGSWSPFSSSSSSSSSYFPELLLPVDDRGYLSSIVPGFASHQTAAAVEQQQQQQQPPSSSSSSVAFLERCDSSSSPSSGFPERPLLPMLASYSTKTSNFPARSSLPSSVRNNNNNGFSSSPQCLPCSPSTSIIEGFISEFWGVSSLPSQQQQQQERRRPSFLSSAANSSFPNASSSGASAAAAVIVSDLSSREAEVPLAALVDCILMEEEEEDFTEESVKKATDTSYQVMAKEIANLIGDACVSETTSCGSDIIVVESCSNNNSSSSSFEICDYDNSWIDEILGVPEKKPQEQTADKELFTNGPSTVVADVSPPSGSRGGFGLLSVGKTSLLSGIGMDSSSCEYYMSEVLNVSQYLDREARAPARIGYGPPPESPLVPQQLLEHAGGRRIPTAGGKRCWFDAVDLPRVDLADLLLRCAKMVEQNDVRKANDLIGELRQHSSAYGNGVQRMAYYFVEALAARLSGTGGKLYVAICSNCPPPAVLLKAYCLYVDNVPYTKINRLFSNMTILDAFEGASSVHVIDYGISHGIQWQCLIQHLATRPEGPPHLRITGIDRPQPGFNSSERVLETGHRLTEFAKMWRVPFEYHAFAEKWENITTAQLALRHDEVLAVNCFKLHYLLDESVMAESPRKIVLNRIRSLKPKVFVEGVVSAGYNAPFFMSRFRECVRHYSTMFDSVEGSLPPDDPDRVLLEQECFGKEILNIVACEGLERVERAEPYRQWQSRTQRAGFTQRPLNPAIMSKMKAMMRSYPKEFGIGEDGGWILTGWKNHIIYGLSSWEPNLVATSTP